ncbi:GATA type transcriptional activator of nitrogen-regulated proteins, partial [Coemansia erecta]
RTFITCMNCKTTVTPLWRRDPLTNAHLCNRCGLYLKTYNVMHPLTRIKRRAMSTTAKQQNASIEQMDDVEQVPRAANCNPPQLQLLPSNAQRKRRVTPKQQISAGITPRCFNCSAESTPLWRRDPEDNIICNACGLYYKLHAKPRPISMRRPAIKRRNRAAGIAALVLPATAKSVPRADAGSIVGPASGQTGVQTPGGLDFLMHAAELELGQSVRSKHGCTMLELEQSVRPKHGCTMLESLAAVATAEISSAQPAENID